MKKKWVILIIAIGLLVGLWFFVKATHILQSYKASTTANEPNIPFESLIFVSKLKKPALLDFICYRTYREDIGGYIALYRVCGMEGDTVEIREGTLLVNNKTVDDQIDLLLRYAVHKDEFSKHAALFDMNEVNFMEGDTMVYVQKPASWMSEHKIRCKQFILNKDEKDEAISKKFGKDWNQDHFGPVTVPAGHYFVLGDNRYGSSDSRYEGFISKENFLATLIWK